MIRSRVLVVAGLVVLWAVAYLPFLSARDLRLEEGRRATPAREMVLRGNWILPTLYGDPYLNKPPLYFWVVAGMSKLTGSVDELATRLPAALSILAGALLVLFFAPESLSFSTRVLAALLVLACPASLDKGTLGEIDAFLALLVWAAWICWWRGQSKNGTTWTGWLGAAGLLSIAVLTKGPGGPLQFYPGIVAYLFFRGRLAELISRRHLVALFVVILPTLLWVALLITTSPIGFVELGRTWMEQLGLHPTNHGVVLPLDAPARMLSRYLLFPVQLASMFLPWFGLALVNMVRRSTATPLRTFLMCALVGNFILFLAYPPARPRYMLAVLFPVCLLASQLVIDEGALVLTQIFGRLVNFLVWLPMLLVVGSLIAAVLLVPRAIPMLVLLGLVALGWAWVSQHWLPSRALGTCAALAVAILFGRGAICSVLLPWQADRDTNRLARKQLGAVPPGTIWTTRTFPVKGDQCYNFQFYLGTQVRGVRNVFDVADRAPCLVLLTPAEAGELRKKQIGVRTLAQVADRPGVMPGLELIEVKSRTVVSREATSPPGATSQTVRGRKSNPDNGL